VVQPILEAMAVRREPVLLDLDSQRLLAVWAVKTVYLLELASLGSAPAKLIEPPRSMVWLACWDSKTPNAVNRASTVNYAPSTAPLPTPDGGEVTGQFTTLAVGFAAFQVFTADYVEVALPTRPYIALRDQRGQRSVRRSGGWLLPQRIGQPVAAGGPEFVVGALQVAFRRSGPTAACRWRSACWTGPPRPAWRRRARRASVGPGP
jgi:hypothetical protein